MKLVGAYINDELFKRLVALAEANNRTLAGQCRHLFEQAAPPPSPGSADILSAPASGSEPTAHCPPSTIAPGA